jgi:radical SAM-linked protein
MCVVAIQAEREISVTRRRLRIRFQKGGDLRLVSHLDLVRAMERLFRRAGVQLSMSEGYHPKPRMSFPLALSLGIEGLDEVLELQVLDHRSTDALNTILREQSPNGLVFKSIEEYPIPGRKAAVSRVHYEMPLPEASRRETVNRVARLLDQLQTPDDSEDEPSASLLQQGLIALSVDGDVLRMELRMGRNKNVHPRDVLAELGLDELEGQGGYLRRTKVELSP